MIEVPRHLSQTSFCGCRTLLAIGLSLAATLPSLVAQMTWGAVASGATDDLYGAAFGSGIFVAVSGFGESTTSTDGQSWSPAATGVETVVQSVEFGGGAFLAVGESGEILRSADGLAWAGETSGTSDYLNGSAFGNGRWVVVGETLLTSDAAGVWVERNSGTGNFLSKVAYGGGQFVAVGAGGTIRRSPDGTSWSPATSGTTRYLTGLAYLQGQFVAVGQRGTILVSDDGETWNAKVSNSAAWLYDVDFGGGTFVAVGEFGTILTSTDLNSWAAAASGTEEDLFTVAFGNSNFIAGGGLGELLRSEAPAPPGFADWLPDHFTAAEIDDPTISGPDADPDCDGIANLFEWGQFLDPRAFDAVSILTPMPTPEGDLVLTYTEYKARPLDYTVMASDTLAAWQALGTEPVVDAEDADTKTLLFVDADAIALSPSRSYRVEANLP